MKAIDNILEMLPGPILTAVALIVLAAWLTKEIKPHSSYGGVIQDPYWQVFCLVIVLSAIGFYGIQFILSANPVSEFSTKERGIAIARFSADTENQIQTHTYEALRTAFDGNSKFPDITFKKIDVMFDESTGAFKLTKAIHTALLIYGSYISPDVVHYRMAVPSKSDEARLPPVKFPDTHPLEEVVGKFLNSTPPAGSKDTPIATYFKRQYDSVVEKNTELYNK